MIYSLGGYDRSKTPATMNPILRKWVQFRVGVIPSEPSFRSDNKLEESFVYHGKVNNRTHFELQLQRREQELFKQG